MQARPWQAKTRCSLDHGLRLGNTSTLETPEAGTRRDDGVMLSRPKATAVAVVLSTLRQQLREDREASKTTLRGLV